MEKLYELQERNRNAWPVHSDLVVDACLGPAAHPRTGKFRPDGSWDDGRPDDDGPDDDATSGTVATDVQDDAKHGSYQRREGSGESKNTTPRTYRLAGSDAQQNDEPGEHDA